MNDKQLTPEAAARVRAYTGIAPEADFSYVPVAWRGQDIPNDVRPVFTLRGINGVESCQDEDQLHGAVERDDANGKSIVHIQSGEYKLRVCERGIRGWRNLHRVDNDGRLTALPDVSIGGMTRARIRELSPALIAELCRAIERHSVLTEEELRGFGL